MSTSKCNENPLYALSSEKNENEVQSASSFKTCGTSSNTGLSRMALNDNKAGMEGLDKERINQIIFEASKGSKFFENEKKKEEQLNIKISEQKIQTEKITPEKKNEGIREANKYIAELDANFDLSHTIVHVDMDAFYAAVEMRDDPSLKHKPMAVGGMGMLSTSNYIARRFGVRAAMPGFIGLKLCPDLVMVKPNFEKYTAVSKQIRQILAVYDPNFCPMSLDEAYLDFTTHLKKRANSSAIERMFILREEENIVQEMSSSTGEKETCDNCACDLNEIIRPQLYDLEEIQKHKHSDTGIQKLINSFSEKLGQDNLLAKFRCSPCPSCGKTLPKINFKVYGVGIEEAVLEMRNRIQQRTHLTASAGIAPNTMLAKICSDRKKPNGQFQIHPDRAEIANFVENLPVRKISGIGKVSEKLLGALGVETCSDLYKQRGILYHLFSPTSFHYFMRISMGIGSSTVERDGDRKSMSTEQTFSEIHEEEELMEKCHELSISLARDMQDEQLVGKTVTLKIKTVNFEVKTRSHTLQHYCSDESSIFSAAKQLLRTEIEAEAPKSLRLRLMGVRMSKLIPQSKSVSIADMFQRQPQKLQTREKTGVKILSSVQHPEEDKQISDSDEENFEGPFEISAEANVEPGKVDVSPDSYSKRLSKSPGKQKKRTFKGPSRSIATFFNKMSEASEKGSKSISQSSGVSSTDQNEILIEKETKSESSAPIFIDLSSEDKQNEQSFRAECSLQSDHLESSRHAPSWPNSNNSILESRNMIQCPICFQQKLNWPLDHFNSHVDLCLSRQREMPSQKEIKTSVSDSMPVVNVDLCTDDTQNQQSLGAQNSIYSGGSENIRVSPCSNTSDSVAEPRNMIQCPICFHQKLDWSLDHFNAHVDLCLSRQTIKDILQVQEGDKVVLPATSQKRSRQEMESAVCGKRVKVKGASLSQRSVLSFFQK